MAINVEVAPSLDVLSPETLLKCEPDDEAPPQVAGDTAARIEALQARQEELQLQVNTLEARVVMKDVLVAELQTLRASVEKLEGQVSAPDGKRLADGQDAEEQAEPEARVLSQQAAELQGHIITARAEVKLLRVHRQKQDAAQLRLQAAEGDAAAAVLRLQVLTASQEQRQKQADEEARAMMKAEAWAAQQRAEDQEEALAAWRSRTDAHQIAVASAEASAAKAADAASEAAEASQAAVAAAANAMPSSTAATATAVFKAGVQEASVVAANLVREVTRDLQAMPPELPPPQSNHRLAASFIRSPVRRPQEPYGDDISL
eukprot:NODE_9501_length_1420_cov_2.897912.p1 GENE.NODE_9501_length_1420_cov_2.897912~~NODE_9501_length_1420_cov_2.897912.p1  ORF type:complete len:356 (+),score=105.65 NODE_9501_length_1420_cov_2.897912:116-1069(+)